MERNKGALRDGPPDMTRYFFRGVGRGSVTVLVGLSRSVPVLTNRPVPASRSIRDVGEPLLGIRTSLYCTARTMRADIENRTIRLLTQYQPQVLNVIARSRRSRQG
jgi:hypothetical protein